MPQSDIIAANLADTQARLANALAAAGRAGDAAQVIAVSKTFPQAVIRAALEAGHRLFGENKVQEATQKWPALRRNYPDAKLHLVGALQSNKAAQAVGLFDAIHSLDRPKLARVLAEEIQKQGRSPMLFVQVNTGGEAQKAGIGLDGLDAFVLACQKEYGLSIDGLMCLPPARDVPAPHFALLEKRARDLGLSGLSMGMSGDYEIALGYGATHVRLGTAIFGARG